MNYKKRVLVGLLSIIVSAQASWYSDAKNWVNKTVSKVSSVFNRTEKKVKDKVNEIAEEVQEFYQTEMNDIESYFTQEKAQKVQPQQKKINSESVLTPEQKGLAHALGKNVNILEELMQLDQRVKVMLETNSEFDALVAVYVDQILDGFKQTNGIPSSEEEVSMTVINNINTALDDFEAGNITSQDLSNFITKTFDWWKQEYWTEEIFGQGPNEYLSDEDWEKEPEESYKSGGYVEKYSVMAYLEKNASPREKEAVIALLKGGLLEKIRAGKK